MPVYSPHRFKERFLFVGGGGTGKSTAVLSMARHMPYAHFWIIDTDYSYAYERLLDTEFTDVRDRNQCTITETNDWESYNTAVDDALTKGNPETDVFVIDNVTWTWNEVQSWYSDQVHGVDMGDHLLALRQNAKNMTEVGKAIADDGQWQIINKVYKQQVYDRLHKWRGHVILIAEAQETRAGQDKTQQAVDLTAVFGPYGVKPRGQGALHHVTATIVLFKMRSNNEWTFTTVKDRGRAKVNNIKVDEFALQYLKDVAGWLPRKPKGAE